MPDRECETSPVQMVACRSEVSIDAPLELVFAVLTRTPRVWWQLPFLNADSNDIALETKVGDHSSVLMVILMAVSFSAPQQRYEVQFCSRWKDHSQRRSKQTSPSACPRATRTTGTTQVWFSFPWPSSPPVMNPRSTISCSHVERISSTPESYRGSQFQTGPRISIQVGNRASASAGLG